jgi:hypothetical protein
VKATAFTVCFVPVLLSCGGEEECSDVVGGLGGGGGGGEGGPDPFSHRQGHVTVQHLPIPLHKEQGFRILVFSCLYSMGTNYIMVVFRFVKAATFKWRKIGLILNLAVLSLHCSFTNVNEEVHSICTQGWPSRRNDILKSRALI